MEILITIGYIAICIVFFSLAIAIHEFGHFIVALKLGLKVERFSIGFGPAIWKKTWRGVEYRISWIPLGGYVMIPDVDPEGTKKLEGGAVNGEIETGKRDISPWKEIAVAVAGPGMNIFLAVVLAFILSALSADKFGELTCEVTDTIEGMPAEKAGVSFESRAPVGYEIGQQLTDFTTPTFDGREFHLADTRGKIVFINFWGTYCTPCVQELPDFEALLHEHEGEVAVIAVHSSMTGEIEPQDYVKSKGWDKWTLPFALDDEEEDTIFTIANGGSTLPQTIVLNRRGEVVYNRVGSVTPEMLEALYKQADAETPAAP